MQRELVHYLGKDTRIWKVGVIIDVVNFMVCLYTDKDNPILKGKK